MPATASSRGRDPGPAARPGPGSLTWRCASDTRGVLVAPAALLLQVAHPVVGAGVAAHSNFTAAPWARLFRTMRSVDRVVFGSDQVAAAEGRRLQRLHAGIRGVDPAGRPYHGLDPGAYAWVHLTLFQLFVDVQRVFGEPLTPSQQGTLYLEWRQVGRVLRVRDEYLPASWSDFRLHFDDTVARVLEANQAVDDVLTAVAHPRNPFPAVPARVWDPVACRAGELSRLLSLGVLPPVLRQRLGIPWTTADQERFARQAYRLRSVLAALPRPVVSIPPSMPYLLRARVVRTLGRVAA